MSAVNRRKWWSVDWGLSDKDLSLRLDEPVALVRLHRARRCPDSVADATCWTQVDWDQSDNLIASGMGLPVRHVLRWRAIVAPETCGIYRIYRLTPAQRMARSKAGRASASRLTPEQRRERGRAAARARWGRKV